VWALVRSAEADEFLDRWGREYRAAFPERAPHAAFFVTRAGPGMERL